MILWRIAALILCLICQSLDWTRAAEPRFKITFTKLDVFFNASVIQVSGNISTDAKGLTYMNIYLTTRKNLTPYLMVTVTLFKMNKGGRYRLYVNSTFNICDSIKIARLTPFVKLLYTHLTNHMNRELECPVKKDSYYTFTNCGQIAEYIPPYIPVGEYRLNFKYFIDIKRNPVFVTSMIVHVITEPINKRTKN